MFGIVAVGTEDGHVYLVDLKCDQNVEEYLLNEPASLLIIDPADTEDIIKTRENALGSHTHCCIDLSCKLFFSLIIVFECRHNKLTDLMNSKKKFESAFVIQGSK